MFWTRRRCPGILSAPGGVRRRRRRERPPPENAMADPDDLGRFVARAGRSTTRRAGRAARRAQAQPLDVVRVPADRRARAQPDRARFAVSRSTRRGPTSRTRCSAAAARVRRRARGAERAQRGGVLGGIDAMKLRSSMTLFAHAAPDEPVFRAGAGRYFGGVADEQTTRAMSCLRAAPRRGSAGWSARSPPPAAGGLFEASGSTRIT